MSNFKHQFSDLQRMARGEDTTAGAVRQSADEFGQFTTELNALKRKYGVKLIQETEATQLTETAPNDQAGAWGVAGRVEAHRRIVTGLTDLYERKNRDYGDSFHKTYLEEGCAMSRIRLSDKLERFKQLSKGNGQRVKDESIRDTLLDLANYAIMTVIEMDREAQP